MAAPPEPSVTKSTTDKISRCAVYLSPKVSKGNALIYVCEQLLNRTPDHAIAVGDGINDLSMLDKNISKCGITFAVSTAQREILSVVDFVTEGSGGAAICEVVDLMLKSQLARMH